MNGSVEINYVKIPLLSIPAVDCFLCSISIASSDMSPVNITITSTVPGSIMYRKISCADMRTSCAGTAAVGSLVVAVVAILVGVSVPWPLLGEADDAAGWSRIAARLDE